VDMLRNQLLVSRSYDGPTKSGKSRVIPISSALEKVLLAKTFGKGYNRLGSKRSGNIVPSNFDPNPPLKRACREAGIRNITFHSLRLTFATLALEAGRSPVLVSKVLGHARTSTTIDLYWASSGEKLDLGFLDE
jgi:integrase